MNRFFFFCPWSRDGVEEGMCVFGCTCVYKCTCTCMFIHVRVRGQVWVSSSVTIFWDWVYDWNWSSLIWLAWRTSKTWRFPCLGCPQCWDFIGSLLHLAFYIGAGDPDSGLHVRMTSTSPTEPLPQAPALGGFCVWLGFFFSSSFFSCSQSQAEIPMGTIWWPAVSPDIAGHAVAFISGVFHFRSLGWHHVTVFSQGRASPLKILIVHFMLHREFSRLWCVLSVFPQLHSPLIVPLTLPLIFSIPQTLLCRMYIHDFMNPCKM